METGKAIYNILSTAELSGGATVHPELAPEGTDFPFVVYSIQNIRPSDVKGSTSALDESTLEVYVMSNNYGQCMTVAAECRTALDRNAGTFSDVEVQSINFDTAEVSYNEPQECYFVEQIYSVRILRTGQANAATLLPLNAASLQIQEEDASPQAYCTRLIFPNGTLSIDSSGGPGAGIANYTPVYEVSSFRPDATYLQGGGQQIDFSSSTPQGLPFDVEISSSGTGIHANAGGAVYADAAGYYRCTAFVSFTTDQQGHAPHFYLMVETRKEAGEAGGLIPTQHSVDHQPNQLSRVLYLEANERVVIMAYDESDKTGAVYVESALLEVERMA